MIRPRESLSKGVLAELETRIVGTTRDLCKTVLAYRFWGISTLRPPLLPS